MSERDPTPLEDALGHRFRDPTLLETALSHASHAHEAEGSRGNERLEYLGDAVLDLVVARLLYDAHPDWAEGELTRARAALVNRKALAARARGLELGRFLKLGRTELRSGGAEKDSVLADAFEALVGAVYLDGGFDRCLEVLRALLGAVVTELPPRDAKTELQEWAHAAWQLTPRYRTVGDTGQEDDEQRFTVEVRIGETVWACGVGRSKRSAERAAAREALARRDLSDG